MIAAMCEQRGPNQPNEVTPECLRTLQCLNSTLQSKHAGYHIERTNRLYKTEVFETVAHYS